MRLRKALDMNLGLTESRETSYLMAPSAEKHGPTTDFIEDIASSEQMLVDDLTKVFEILKEIKNLGDNQYDSDSEYSYNCKNWNGFE
jgi:hypothetical protein